MINLRKSIETLSPSYFALVMATGIVASSSQLHSYPGIGRGLFFFNNAAFLVLLLLLVLRLFLFFPQVINDLSTHAKGAGFLTVVAASNILGNGYAQAGRNFILAALLWYFGLVLWVVLLYAFLARVILQEQKPSPENGLHGIWFLLVVATQSIVILGCSLAGHLALAPDTILFVSLVAFFLGVMFYLLLVPIVTYRLLFYPVKPEEVVPTYWITMGSAAITALAGVTLSKNIIGHPVFGELFFFVKPVAVLFWSVASFWIPLVLLMELWRYLYKKSPLRYTPAFWSMVFPLGMYSVCTARLAEVLPLPFLPTLSKLFLYFAWIAWIATFLGWCFHLPKQLRKASGENHPVHG